jgi:predicted CopG family antitoxin
MPTLDRESLREIVSILKEHKRKDLIEILQDACDGLQTSEISKS